MAFVTHFIAAQTGWGAGRPSASQGPEAFIKSAYYTPFKAIPLDMLMSDLPYAEGVSPNYEEKKQLIVDFNAHLAEQVKNIITHGEKPVILGGDHSLAMGSWRGVTEALQAKENFGLIWIDAHMDSHTDKTTPSHNIHGMPLAALLGKGDKALRGDNVILNPRHVVLVGVRSFEKEEATLLENLNVKIYFMEEVKERGIDIILEEARAWVTNQTKGFGISLDLDAFDPTQVPGTGVREPNGLLPEEFYKPFSDIVRDEKFQALEIVEFDPNQDKDNKSLQVIAQLLSCLPLQEMNL